MANWCELNWAARLTPVLVNLDNAVSIRNAPTDDRYAHKGKVTRVCFSEGSGDYVDVVETFAEIQALAMGTAPKEQTAA